IGWRGAMLAVYCIAALVSPVWSIDRALSVDGGLEVAKHFLFFLAVANTLNTPQRIRTALLFYAAAAIVPGWGTLSTWWHDQLLATAPSLVATASMLLFAPATFWQPNQTIRNYEDPAIQGRLQAWDVARRIFQERPLLGVGESAFMSAWKQDAPIDDPVEYPYVAHNLELEVLGQLGVVGLFGIAGFIICCLWSGWRARNG